MKREELAQKILDIKRGGWTWARMAEEIGRLSRSSSSAPCSAR